MQPRYVIVADPASLRCRFFVRELEEFWAESARVPDIQIVDWRQLCAGQLWKGLFEQKYSSRNMRTAHARPRYGIVAIHSPGRPDIFAGRNDLRMDIECSAARTLRRTSSGKATDRMGEGHIPIHAAYRKNIDRIGLDALRRIEHAVARSGIPT